MELVGAFLGCERELVGIYSPL